MKIVVENLKVLYKGVGEPNDKFNNPIQLSTQSKFRDSVNINELLYQSKISSECRND